MRIVYVCSDPGVPVFGSNGASIHVRELCRALDELGHEVLVVSARTGGRRPYDFRPEVLELGVEPELVAVIREFRADVVYERYALGTTAGAAAARALGIPHLLEVDAPLSDEQMAFGALAFGELARGLERAIVCGADRVVAVSSGVYQWLLGLGVESERVAAVANAVDPRRFAVGRAARAATRIRLGLGDALVVGFVGTLKPWHDVASLVRAVGLLAAAGMRLRLLVIGDGPERARLEELARAEGVSDATIFLGSVEHDEVPLYLAALDVAAATYDESPGFYFSPLKVFEYLAAGCPVVAADVGDIGHCVRHAETGFLYPPGDAEALAQALLCLLLDPNRSAELAAAGREHVRKHHTWTGNARAVIRLAREGAAACA